MPLFCARRRVSGCSIMKVRKGGRQGARSLATHVRISSLGGDDKHRGIGSTDQHGQNSSNCIPQRKRPNTADRAGIAAKFRRAWRLTVDKITGGNTGTARADRLHLAPALDALKKPPQFALHPRWAADDFMHEKFELPQLKDLRKEGFEQSLGSVGDYFSTMLGPINETGKDARMSARMGKQFCLKGSLRHCGRKALPLDIGATASWCESCGRQLDGVEEPV